MKVSGTVSWFGGPEDTGVTADEGLAFWYDYEEAPWLFLDEQPSGTTGLARRLNPDVFFIATRWNYDAFPKEVLREMRDQVLIYAPKTDRAFLCSPADWGPHEEKTGRAADISKGLLDALGIETDDEVTVIYPIGRGRPEIEPPIIAISSGHSTKCQGAVGLINEVEEATRVTNALGKLLRHMGCIVHTFHDTKSTSQEQNLSTIANWHDSLGPHDLDIFVHFNASEPTSEPRGTEVWYYSQEWLANELSAAMAHGGGFKDRGGKYSDDLYVLNHTMSPGVLLEVCFVDSEADVELYQANFHRIIGALAGTLVSEMATV